MSLSNVNEGGMEMELQMPTPDDEHPPPPPPKEWRAAALPAPAEAKAPVSPPRTKKKVPWKGKSILVLLPRDDERGQKGKGPVPMTSKDVTAMMKEWEQLGYDTTGFNLGPESVGVDEGSQGQSRSPWPLVQDINNERRERDFRISIPDKAEWDAYVRELSEAKLRALGVSFGDEDPPAPTISPAVSNMSRRVSMQYPPLPFSPPLPTSSANSSHITHQPNPFSPTLMPGAGMSTSQSSNPGSIASPASMQAHMQGKFNPRASVSFSGEHPFGSPFQYPQQQSPGVWSPQQMLYQQGHARGGSPSLANLQSMMSPASPFSQDGYFPQNGDMLSQLQQRQQILQTQLTHQQQLQLSARASPRLQEVRETEDEDLPSKSPSKTPEARQIKHNPSASLQKEIDDAEYHLEEQFQRQLEHEDYSPHSDKAEDGFDKPATVSHARQPSAPQGLGASQYATDDDEGPILHHPQPHSRGHSLSQRPFQDSEESGQENKPELLGAAAKPDLSDIETNPSNLGTPIPTMDLSTSGHSGHGRAMSAASNPWADSDANHTEDSTIPKRGHATKPSMSKLNVAAKEFKFDPKNVFNPLPNQFAFGANTFQPPPVSAYAAFAPPVSATSSHFSNHSIASSKGRINVGAPAFTPGQSEFSFSASGPSFRPDAPAFTPQAANLSDSMGSGSEGLRTSIFGSIDLNALGISKPTKKSKAIPIIRPDSSEARILEDETMEGKDGRITQGEGRFKRSKAGKDGGDSVPLFADSMPLGETTREQSPPKESTPAATKPADKENSAPLGDSGEEETSAAPAKTHARDFSMNSPQSGGKDFAPWEFDNQNQAADFNAARPITSKRYGSGLPAYGNYALSSDEPQTPVEPEKPKGHKKSLSSLSATAKPFEFRPGAFNFTFGQPSPPIPTEAPAAAPNPSAPVSVPTSGGLGASRYARSPTPEEVASPEVNLDHREFMQFQDSLPGPSSPATYTEEPSYVSEQDQEEPKAIHEQSIDEIDDIMNHMNQIEQSAPLRDEVPTWLQPSPQRQVQMPENSSSPIRLLPQNLMRSDAPSPSPRRFHPLPGQSGVFGRVPEDPFVGETPPQNYESPVRRLGTVDSLPPSEWDDVLSETEEAKLQPRAQFFDNHVNELVGGLLAERLDPLERTLETIQMSLDMMAARAPSSRRQRRSVSGALSDADDEDDDNPRRSLSPRRDPKMEKIRAIVTEALNAHQPSRPQTATTSSEAPDSRMLKALEEMKEQFGASMRLDLRGEDLRNIVEEAVERRMPSTPQPFFDEAAAARETEYRQRIADLEEKLTPAKPVIDEAAIAREAEYKARIADLEEKLLRAEGESSSRVADLEERLGRTEDKTEQEVKTRRAAEDRLAEVQRLLRISSEEEVRLREAMDEREIKIREIVDESDMKVRSVEEQRAKTTMRIALLEAAQDNAQRSQSELQNRINITEIDLREANKETQRWQIEAERALEAARRHSDDAEQANETNKELRRTIDSLRTQMEESIRVREGMRGKLMDLQEDMARAARDISEENARRAKKEAELLARQEVLDAKLQAEARTRERLETEIERLEAGEREGMRAVNDAKKLDLLIEDLRQENHVALKDAMRYKREFEEAKESGLAEVQRTTHYMQTQVDFANNQVNVVREDLENQVARVRAELDQVKLDADTARAKSEMLLEEAETTKQSVWEEMKRKQADAIEDLETQHKRQLNNAIEDAERSEQHLLERLSLSSAKTEHLQNRVVHLEEKLEIANQAAAAAATAAKTARSASTSGPAQHKPISRGMELPEKISPQALRESIMVLQEQLQDREATIEQLEATLSTMDLDAPTKIQKRDDEIMWLRELLAVRKGDLQDIVQSLEAEQFDAERVRDAAIRLRANLQMEEQERERAMNGGSSINLPNIAASLRDVASSPRVAQAVGPLAAAWGNWRKGRSDLGQEMQAGQSRSNSSTPARSSPGNQNSFLSGLLTPPASTARQGTPPTTLRHSLSTSSNEQPTAFGSTGNKMTMAQARSMPRQPVRASPAKSRVGAAGPSTPPMMRKSSYDADARAEDFSDAGFYDDDESQTTVEEYGGGMGSRREGKSVRDW
ncbi:related to myosin heavy chain [Phialocephala subalpina]|uniref:Related to myosin heavy chain n=1 Tax=Phialocephala subalpina TaxID=576137 RepID=A0A1L7XEW1_9HELO|nr:related to myosin heavy chain [Phialocephala subalpina]